MACYPLYTPKSHQCDCSKCPANIDCPWCNPSVKTIRLGTRVTELERRIKNKMEENKI